MTPPCGGVRIYSYWMVAFALGGELCTTVRFKEAFKGQKSKAGCNNRKRFPPPIQ